MSGAEEVQELQKLESVWVFSETLAMGVRLFDDNWERCISSVISTNQGLDIEDT